MFGFVLGWEHSYLIQWKLIALCGYHVIIFTTLKKKFVIYCHIIDENVE